MMLGRAPTVALIKYRGVSHPFARPSSALYSLTCFSCRRALQFLHSCCTCAVCISSCHLKQRIPEIGLWLLCFGRCSSGIKESFVGPTRPTRFECHRALCLSDDDRFEAPMMLPTSKAVKWIAAHILSRMPDGTQKSTVCMRGERGRKKMAPYLFNGALECPDIDAVCSGRPCKNGGIPKYGM